MGSANKKYNTVFLQKSEEKAFDKNHRKTIRFNISKYYAAVDKGLNYFSDLDLARKRAGFAKHRIVNELDKYLIEFEANFIKRGGKIIWAQDKDEAIREITKILKERDVKMVVKSKSMITEEIELNESLAAADIKAVETDLGEYIVQIDNDKPYHIVTPAMHKSKEDIAELFHKKFGTPKDSTPEEITGFVRKTLREKFITADAGITGANFLVADIGAVALTENEGNGLMSTSWPKVHIAIAGIEKIVPSLKDLDLFWPILSTHGTGQHLTVYNSIFTGPKQENEVDGPEEMFLILLDNGRSHLLAQKHQRRSLSCIRCGACLNYCPVYRNIGGHTYGATYSGPIGSVIMPNLQGYEKFKHLSFASSLCGKCSEVCPVQINIHELLLYNRRDSVKKGFSPRSEKIVMFGYKKAMLKRKWIDMFGSGFKNTGMQWFVRKTWGPRRDLPVFARKSFNKTWLEYKGLK